MNLLTLREQSPADYGLTRASLIQKLIRRSLLPEALWVVKLFIEDGHEKGLKRRLLQIAAEDVGLAQPQAISYLRNEPDLYKQIALLCLSEKNREPDQFMLSIAYDREKFINHPDPQVRLEAKTLADLLEVSGVWFSNKRLKVNRENLHNFFFKLSQDAPLAQEILLCEEIYVELSKANTHGARALLGLAVLLSVRKVKPRPLPDLTTLPDAQIIHAVPDFALDMHTPEGRKLGRGFDHWLKIGSVVSPLYVYPELYDCQGQEKYALAPLIPILKSDK